jgi:transcriptional regulator
MWYRLDQTDRQHSRRQGASEIFLVGNIAMYIPNSFRRDDPEELVAFMRAHDFVTLVSCVEGVPLASHIPVVIRYENGVVTLTGHLARANSHWKAFGSGESMAIFSGPHAYISPSLYEKPESVPTWNYIAVHAYGTPRAIMQADASEALGEVLTSLIMHNDPAYLRQWQGLSDRYREGMLNGIVGFEMPVTRLEGKYKLSQNRSEADQARVAEALLQSADPTVAGVGAAMKQNLERHD